MRFTTDAVAFAAERRTVLEQGDERLGPLVSTALVRLRRTPSAEWYSGVIAEMRSMWNSLYESEAGEPPSAQAEEQREEFLDRVERTLGLTTEPEPTVAGRQAQHDRITRWLSTATVNDATVSAATWANDGEAPLLEWVTMEDDDVRQSHREVAGQQRPVGETFTVDGTELPYPGAPVGPPEVWINCRCVLRPTLGGDEMGMKNMATFATDENLEDVDDIIGEVDEEVDPDAPTVDDLDEERVPFHGVLAPIGVMSGDRRRFLADALTWREGPGPLPLRWVKSDVGAHQGAVRIGVFDNIWIDEEEQVVKHEGHFTSNEEAQEAISLLADGAMGVSVDLDQMVANVVNEDGSEFDFEMWSEGDPEPVLDVSTGRISAATLVDIPAFAEAYVALGPWADASLEAACIPCEAAAAVEEMTEEQREEFEAALVAMVEDDTLTITASAVKDTRLADAMIAAFIEKFAPGTKDGPGWITNPDDTQRLRDYWTRGEGAAKIRWGQPGDFNRCRKQLAKYVKNPQYLAGTCANLHKVALGVWPGQEKAQAKEGAVMASAFTMFTEAPDALVAAGARPASWFSNPGLTGPTPVTITDDGHIYGHVATFDVCHIANPEGQDICTTAPRSVTDYAYFKTGIVRTDEGEVAVGHITMGTGHAGGRLNAARAAAHYDNTGAVVADVTVGEDAYGIWFSGAVRPGLDDEMLDALRAAALSGDWRKIRGNLEMVAALAVNVPGFPIPRASLAASADEGQYSLTASGVVWAREGDVAKVEALDPEEFATHVIAAMQRQEALAAARETFSAYDAKALARAREALRK